MARFFIDRPIFAWVISIVIVLAGWRLRSSCRSPSIPEITPPTVQVTCQYAGANAVVVADTVAAPIEQQVNGVEDMLYMSSQSANDGSYNLTVTFKLGTSLDMAQVLVQNRVSQAMPMLPDVVKATGVTVKKRSPSILLVVNLVLGGSTREPKQALFRSALSVELRHDRGARRAGPDRRRRRRDAAGAARLQHAGLARSRTGSRSRNLTADDVVTFPARAKRASGRRPARPAARALGGVDFQYTMTTLGRLAEPDQFGDIVIKSGEGGRAHAAQGRRPHRAGRQEPGRPLQLDGKPSAWAWPSSNFPASNALDTADRVRAKMEELQGKFEKGLEYAIVYDTTPFVEESVAEVFHTLRDAVILVAIVILLFLQDWKSVILPLIDIGVSLVGTFAVMYMLGFTLNNLTLFGLVLAIGIVVDDAIVVLENIERWLAKGLPVREATLTRHARDHRPDHRHDAGHVFGVSAQRLDRRESRDSSIASLR